jgi:hypothetical protein
MIKNLPRKLQWTKVEGIGISSDEEGTNQGIGTGTLWLNEEEFFIGYDTSENALCTKTFSNLDVSMPESPVHFMYMTAHKYTGDSFYLS